MKDRIKKVREDSKLNQAKFGEKILISRSAVWKIENGENVPSEQTIRMICQAFDVNEDWLRTGEGVMHPTRTKNQEIINFMNNTMELPDKNFQKRLIEALAKLDSDDWAFLEKIVEKVLKEG